MISEKILKKLAPTCSANWVTALNSAMQKFEIIRGRHQAAFLAQVLHESAGLMRLQESFNYSPAGILGTLNSGAQKRFSAVLAEKLGRTETHPAQQEKIANIAYAGRLGNGDATSGDGWRYRGRGPIQLTGKINYLACAPAIGVDIVSEPDLLLDLKVGSLAAAWFWARGNSTGKSLGDLLDAKGIDAVSKVINGGDRGVAERAVLFKRAWNLLVPVDS